MKSIPLFSFFMVAFAIGCGSSTNTPEYACKQYLLALKDHNYERAKEFADSPDYIDCMLRIHQDFAITDARDIVCEEEGNTAKCYFCCWKDNPSQLRLVKSGNAWRIADAKETCPDEVPIEEEEEPSDSIQ